MSDASYWQDASDTVLRGTFLSAGSTAFITGIYQIFKRHPNHGRLSALAGLNGGLVAVTFFGLRDLVITPALIATIPASSYARKRSTYDWKRLPSDSELPPRTWTEMRTDSLLDSVTSGVLTGGGLRGLMAGRTAVVPAALTAGILCAVLQLSYNEVHVQRVKYVNKMKQQPEPAPSTTRWISPRVLKWIGLTEYTDEEYIAKLKHQRDTHLVRIRQLEEQLEEEQRK